MTIAAVVRHEDQADDGGDVAQHEGHGSQCGSGPGGGGAGSFL